jgi:IclR family acetate operon transcriptional repressor
MARVKSNDRQGERYEIAVVANALDLMTRLAEVDEISAAEAAQLLGLSRSTAYRLLVTLQSRGFVEHDRLTRRWRLGTSFVTIMGRITGTRLRTTALPSMRRLLAEEKETVNLAEFSDGDLVYTQILESPQAFRMSNARGEVVPLHATALGKAVLAAHPREEWEDMVARLELEEITPSTITSVGELLADLEAISSRGWGEDRSETAVGVICIGAAIRAANGMVLGGISVSLPAARFDDEGERRLGPRVAEEAEKISRELASSPPLREGRR